MYYNYAQIISPNFPIAKDFLKLNILYARSNIENKLKNVKKAEHYNFLTHIGYYTGDTFFVGYGNRAKWISLNIIEGSNKFFLHTTLQAQGYSDVTNNYMNQGFSKKNGSANLYEIGNIADPEILLLQAINKIVAILK